MLTATPSEIRNFLLVCHQLVKAEQVAGWPQLALSIGAKPDQLEALRLGNRNYLDPNWINALVKKHGANPNYIYFAQGNPIFISKAAS